MTVQFLSSELNALISESKRKLPELRNAAEKALHDLKALPVTSETQLAADLRRRPHFPEPFIIACNSRSVRYATSGIACLQRLVVSNALHKDRLKDAVDAIRECSAIGVDIQLRVLQTLPALLQNHSVEVKGDLLFVLLQICTSLQASKTTVVSSTAAATFQQLVVSVYDRLAVEDKAALEIPTIADVSINDKSIGVRPVAYDAYRILQDMTTLIEGKKAQSVRLNPVSESSLLEVMEAILVNHSEILQSHSEQTEALRNGLLPFLIRSFSEKRPFPITVRVARSMSIVLRDYLDLFLNESEAILHLLNHTLEPDVAPMWKRVLCMEIFRGLFADYQLVLRIQSHFSGQKNYEPIMRSCLSSFVRLASERPALVGLGQQSTIPVGNYFQREAPEGSQEVDAAQQHTLSAGVSTSAVPGISQQFSIVKTSCIEQLDKSDPPALPETYIYSLVLLSLNGLAESLAKFILPLTVHAAARVKKRSRLVDPGEDRVFDPASADNANELPGHTALKRSHSYRKKTVPENPLLKEGHPSYDKVRTAAKLVEDCWPAILACCSTFFYAALDTENYRALVRSYQKFAQVIGLLRMSTPRDAFLTTLGKAAVPSHVLTSAFPSAGPQSAQSPGIKALLNVDNIVSQASNFLPERSRRPSVDVVDASLNTRNLLCLRALLNLAIALGPTLDTSWTIVFETIQQADNVLAASSIRPGSRDRSSIQTINHSSAGGSKTQLISAEVAAVQAAASRLFESTVDFPNGPFRYVLEALCGLLRGKPARVDFPTQRPHVALHQRRIPSFSGISIKTEAHEQDPVFVLTKIQELSSLNLDRFVEFNEEDSGWTYLTRELTSIAADRAFGVSARRLAAEILSSLAQDTAATATKDRSDYADQVQSRCLSALDSACEAFQNVEDTITSPTEDETAFHTHYIILESLKLILERWGDSMKSGWDTVFKMVQSAFGAGVASPGSGHRWSLALGNKPILRSIELGRLAFSCLQLICSDFLISVPADVLMLLAEGLFRFGSQRDDLNVSLTATHLFRDISDFLYNSCRSSEIEYFSLKIDEASNDDSVSACIEQLDMAAQEHHSSALWFYSLRLAASLATDSRDDVRNGAIRTILTAITTKGDDLAPTTWQLCLRLIWLPVLEENQKSMLRTLASVREMPPDLETMASLNGKLETSSIVIKALSSIISEHFTIIRGLPRFTSIWRQFTCDLDSYASLELSDLSAEVYAAITAILRTRLHAESIRPSELGQVSKLWKKQFPRSRLPVPAASAQKAFENYIALFGELYSLDPTIAGPENIQLVTSHFYRCVVESECSAYSSDMDSLTSLQSQVMRCLGTIHTDEREVLCAIIKLLSQYTALPDGEAFHPGKLSYIALSRAAMHALPNLVNKHIADETVFNADVLLFTLTSLERQIQLKYVWPVHGKPPKLWQKATSTSVDILKYIVPKLAGANLQQNLFRKYWEVVVRIAGAIIQTKSYGNDTEKTSSPYGDEDFDVKALERLRGIIIPALGSPLIPDMVRRVYCCACFRGSLVHEVEPNEIPDLQSGPLEGLYNLRFGRTETFISTERPKMAYSCLEELLQLVAAADSSIERIKLAQAAAPYLILRAALPLKAYIADQPLRGRMPQPQTERKELLLILSKLRALKSEPKAIPDAEGATSKNRKHLLRLYPLLSNAVGVATRDAEIMEELRGCLTAVGDEFGL